MASRRCGSKPVCCPSHGAPPWHCGVGAATEGSSAGYHIARLKCVCVCGGSFIIAHATTGRATWTQVSPDDAPQAKHVLLSVSDSQPCSQTLARNFHRESTNAIAVNSVKTFGDMMHGSPSPCMRRSVLRRLSMLREGVRTRIRSTRGLSRGLSVTMCLFPFASRRRRVAVRVVCCSIALFHGAWCRCRRCGTS